MAFTIFLFRLLNMIITIIKEIYSHSKSRVTVCFSNTSAIFLGRKVTFIVIDGPR